MLTHGARPRGPAQRRSDDVEGEGSPGGDGGSGGDAKNIVVSCVPKAGLSPCDSSSAEAHLTNADSNPGNNWATS